MIMWFLLSWLRHSHQLSICRQFIPHDSNNHLSPPLLSALSVDSLSPCTSDPQNFISPQAEYDKRSPSTLMTYLQQMCSGMHLKMRTPAEASNPLYKTELCRSFEETGQCRYVGKCQFAHGFQELRVIPRTSEIQNGNL